MTTNAPGKIWAATPADGVMKPETMYGWTTEEHVEEWRLDSQDDTGPDSVGPLAYVEYIRADLTPSPEVVKELVEAAGDFLDAILAEYENGDRKLRITGPTANLKWLIEAEEELRAALAKVEGGE